MVLSRGMRIRRLWRGQWDLQWPPVASSSLMGLLFLVWWMDIEEGLALVPGLLTNPLQAFRLVTYCLCHSDISLLSVSLLFFPLFGWRPELRMGTIHFLYTAVLGAVISALMYLLLAGLWGGHSNAVVSGYTPVHLVFLGSQQWRKGLSGWMSTALLAGALVGLTQALSPQSSFLLHICGLLTGLAYRAGIFFLLEPSDRFLERIHSRIQIQIPPFLHFVRPPEARSLPVTNPMAAAKTQEIYAASSIQFPELFPSESPSQTRGSPSLSPAVPFSAFQEALIEEELLQAGIQASLEDMVKEEVTLSKSSVSSLRLQQLQKMGFATEEAVVALAAVGHVEGAVSLLIGGHVGNDAVVVVPPDRK
ncbi:rhomboid domain-containing protein 3 isoform X1 [Anolis sagrei]|uniref:rhomboid domain-containing protein 3 isoform X1 n=2 Tax=Anolis sagrei TaxID=38937 RepID=UPI003522F890